MYKDKELQKESNRIANQRYRDKKAGITQKPVIEPKNSIQDEPGQVIPVIPDTNDTLNRDTRVIPDVIPCLTIEQIIKLTAAQAKAILKGWALGNGSIYQSVLGNLALEYDKIK